VLADPLARARAFGLDGPFSFPFPVAVKTGTSSDWRDNWAFGYTDLWTIGVWVGAAAGKPMDRVSGTHGAILALRRILLHLYPQDSPQAESAGFPPPAGVERRMVCALSGLAAGDDCPERLEEWFLSSDPPLPRCDWHRRIALDATTGLLARPCTPPAHVREVLFTTPQISGVDLSGESFALWIRDQAWPQPPREMTSCLCGRAGCGPLTAGLLPEWDRARSACSHPALGVGRRTPAGPPACRILRPADGSVYAIDPSLPLEQQELALEGSAGNDPIRWEVDGCEVGRTASGERLFWRLIPGAHRIRAFGLPRTGSDAVTVVVEPGP
jgi:penicillin-binding protein 1C